MLQQATATLSSIFTNKFVVKAIKPTLKLAKVEITSAMTYALNYFDPSTNTVITLSNPAVSDQEGATLVVTSPDELTSYNVSTVKFKTGDTQIGAYVSFPQWVGYTIAGNGIAVGTTITAWYRGKPVDCNPIYLRSGTPGVYPTEQINPGFVLSLIEKTQLKINMASLGIPWVENEAYTFEFSDDFVKGSEPDKNFSSPAMNIAYTANPPLAIASTVPTAGDTGTEVNDYVILNFNRTVVPYIGQNFYFYETDGVTSTLLKTFAVTTSIISRNKITLDVRGLMKESTSYYVLSDEEIVKDSDNFVFNGITNNSTFAFTSAVPVDFRGFISIQVSFGTTLATPYKRTPLAATTVSSLFTTTPNARKTAGGRATITSLFNTITLGGKRQRTTATLTSVFTLVARTPVRATGSITSTSTLSIIITKFKLFSSDITSQSTMTPYIGLDSYAIGSVSPDISTSNIGFGSRVSLDASGEYFAVTLPTDSYTYLFNRSGTSWSQQQRLTDSGKDVAMIQTGPSSHSFFIAKSEGLYRYNRSGTTWTSGVFHSVSAYSNISEVNNSLKPYWYDSGPNVYRSWLSYSDHHSTQDYIVGKQYRVSSDTSASLDNYAALNPGGFGFVSELQNEFDGQYNFGIAGPELISAGLTYSYRDGGTFIDVSWGYVGQSSTRGEYRIDCTSTNSYGGVWYPGDKRSVSIAGSGTYIDGQVLVGLWRDNASNASPGRIIHSIHGSLVDSDYIAGNFTSPDPQTNDYFGKSLALSLDGTLLVVGAPGVGIVYVYNKTGTTFSLSHIIRPDGNSTSEGFGETVALSHDGNYMIIGAPSKNSSNGAIYTYIRI